MMRRLLFVPLALLAAWPAAAQGVARSVAPGVVQAPPNTDIYLARLMKRGDSLVLSAAQNVTRRPGYDNQPAFLADATGFLYTAAGTDGQTDIWRYEMRTRRHLRITATAESEYSPTMMPGGKRFSVVRVERDSAQRLWSFALGGTDPRLLLPALAPVGYHAWLDPERLAAYVLGTPSTLHVLGRDGSDDEVRASDIGRTLSRIPAQEWYSFVQHDSTKTPWIVAQPFEGGEVSRLVRIEEADEFYAWAPDGTLLSASDSAIVRWNGVSGDGSEWIALPSLAPFPVKHISRLAVSPDGRWVAFVAEPATP